MQTAKMDRTQVVIAEKDVLESKDIEYWNSATTEEKLQTITFLRECFYGEEATTGRLQRVHTVLSREDLIKNKKASGRSMDIADAEKIEKHKNWNIESVGKP
jgi:hypothetical protein